MTPKPDNRTIPCIVCGGSLLNLVDEGNQPLHGVEFTANGHYGCTCFDPMDGTRIAVNICDPCVLKARDAGHVLLLSVRSSRSTDTKYETWSAA